MSVLLAILSSEGDNEKLARHWPCFVATGWSLLFCGTLDGKALCPDRTVPQLNTGKLGKIRTPAGLSIWHLIYQETDIWDYFMSHPEFDSVCVTESDGVFIRKPPQEHPGGPYLFSVVPNFSRPGLFKSPVYAQTPRWSDRPMTERLLYLGRQMIAEGDVEHHISDRWPAWICYRHHLSFMPIPAWTPFAFNDWFPKSEDNLLRDIRVAVKCGVWYLHSIKTEAHLKAAEEALEECPA